MLKKIDNAKEFDKLVEKGIWLVDFYATWCGPCKMLSPIVEDISKDYNVIKVDTDVNEELAMRYGIMSIPTLMVFKGGKVVSKEIGYRSFDEIKKMLSD